MKTTCPACGKPWRPWPTSALRTHAVCHFPPATQDEIAAKWERPTIVAQLAAEYKCTPGVIRASVHASKIRRGLPGLR